MKIVADASILVEVAAKEDSRLRAHQLLARLIGEHDVVAPAIAPYEIGNFVFRRFRQESKSLADAEETFRAIMLSVRIEPGDSEAGVRVGRLAWKHRLSFYDASYLELAARDSTSLLLTADRDLLTAATEALGSPRALDFEAAAARFLGGV